MPWFQENASHIPKGFTRCNIPRDTGQPDYIGSDTDNWFKWVQSGSHAGTVSATHRTKCSPRQARGQWRFQRTYVLDGITFETSAPTSFWLKQSLQHFQYSNTSFWWEVFSCMALLPWHCCHGAVADTDRLTDIHNHNLLYGISNGCKTLLL